MSHSFDEYLRRVLHDETEEIRPNVEYYQLLLRKVSNLEDSRKRAFRIYLISATIYGLITLYIIVTSVDPNLTITHI